MKTLYKYAIRSKINGALLRLDFESSSKSESYYEIEFGYDDPILNIDTKISTIFKINSLKKNPIIWYTNSKHIAELVLKNSEDKYLKDKGNMLIPFLEMDYHEHKDLFEIVKISINIDKD